MYCSCDLLQGIIAVFPHQLIWSSVHPLHSWQAPSKTDLLQLHCIALGVLLAGNIFQKLLCLLNANTLQHATLTICLPSCATCLHHQALKTAIWIQTLLRGPGENRRLHLQLPLPHSLCDMYCHLLRSATGSAWSSYNQGQS